MGASRSERRTCVFVRFEATLDLSDAPDAARVRCGQRPGTGDQVGWRQSENLVFELRPDDQISKKPLTETHTNSRCYPRLTSHRPRSGGPRYAPSRAFREVSHTGLALRTRERDAEAPRRTTPRDGNDHESSPRIERGRDPGLDPAGAVRGACGSQRPRRTAPRGVPHRRRRVRGEGNGGHVRGDGRVHRRQSRRRRLRRRHVRRGDRLRAGERGDDRVARSIEALSVGSVRQRLRGVRAPADGPGRELARVLPRRVQHIGLEAAGVAVRHPGHDRAGQTAVRAEQGTPGGLRRRRGQVVREAQGRGRRVHTPAVSPAGPGGRLHDRVRVLHR